MKLRIAVFVFALTSSQVPLSASASISRQSVQQETESPELAEALRLSASVVKLFADKKYEEALRPAKRALELREKVLAKDSELVIDAVLNVAEIQYVRRRLVESRGLFERALKSCERSLGGANPRCADISDRLAVNHYALRERGQTERTYQQALAIREKHFGVHDQETARSVRNLAEFYQNERDFKAAEPLYQRLISIRTKSSNLDAIAEAFDRYACLLRKTNRLAAAEKIEERNANVGGFSKKDDAGVVNGKATYLALPSYPPEAVIDRLSGRVIVRVLINEKGDVVSVCATDGAPKLWRASEAAARSSQFSPTILDGKPVKITGRIVYNFVAQ